MHTLVRTIMCLLLYVCHHSTLLYMRAHADMRCLALAVAVYAAPASVFVLLYQ